MKYLSLSLIFLLSSLSKITSGRHRSTSNVCPAQEDIPKCRCSEQSGGLYVTCSRLQTDTELKNHLDILRSYSLKKLEVNKYNASSIPTDLWKGLKIKKLSLGEVNVGDASFRRGKRHFQGLEQYLEGLHIDRSFKKEQRPLLNLQLDQMEKLKDIIFERNGIPEVGNDWFTSGPKELSVLIFEHNNIEELGDKAFSCLSNLKLLAVAGNHFHTISRTMFPQPADKLVTLDLAFNKINILPQDIFSGMPSLEDVNLDQNLIHVIREDTWKPISSQLTALSLRGNALKCDESMKWICGTSLKNAMFGRCSDPVEMRSKTPQEFCKN